MNRRSQPFKRGRNGTTSSGVSMEFVVNALTSVELVAVPNHDPVLGVGRSSTSWTHLALCSTYSSYSFQLAGLSDPFLGKVISNTISLVDLLLIVATVETVGRRNLACWALTLQ